MKKRTDGRYRTTIVIGKKEDGTSIKKYIYGRTQKELQEKKQEAIEYYIKGNKKYIFKSFGEYAVNWYEIRKKPFISEVSQRSYRTVMNNHVLPTFGNRNISAITSMDVQKYLNELGKTKSMSLLYKVRDALVSIFDGAIQDGFIAVNPAKHINLRGKQKKEKHILTEDERKILEKACKSHEDNLIIAVMYYTGMRSGEARALRWEHISMIDQTITIKAAAKETTLGRVKIGKPKTESSIRKIPLPEPLFEILEEKRLSRKSEYVLMDKEISRPITYNYFIKRYNKIMTDIGLTNNGVPIITPHGLRHNMATMFWENGFDPFTSAKLLGHKSIKTTLDTYTHLSEKGMENASRQVNELFRGSEEGQKNTPC